MNGTAALRITLPFTGVIERQRAIDDDRFAYGDALIDLALHITQTSACSYVQARDGALDGLMHWQILHPDVTDEPTAIASVRALYDQQGLVAFFNLRMGVLFHQMDEAACIGLHSFRQITEALGDREPTNRHELRQQRSPRYRAACSHGAGDQRDLAHKAWNRKGLMR